MQQLGHGSGSFLGAIFVRPSATDPEQIVDTGEVLVALQSRTSSGDASRDVAQAILTALASEPGSSVNSVRPATADTPRLQDLLAEGQRLEIEVHDDFGFWLGEDATEEQKAAFRAEGREPVLRLRMPDEDITFTDLVRGEVTFPAGSIPDFVIVRGNGAPLYTLVNPVDDAMMRITHVIRGEDLLSSTPRQIVLYRALAEIGVAERVPTFAHLPLVLGEGNKKLSKRDPQADLFLHRERGFIREGMVNYLALLGWAIGPDRDIFEPDDLVEAFDVRDVNPNPARWDQKKAESINGDHIRRLPLAEFTSRLLPTLRDAGVLGAQSDMGELARLEQVADLIQTRVQVLSEAVPLVGPFYVEAEDLPIADDARAQLKDDAPTVLDSAISALAEIPGGYPEPLGGGVEWTTGRIEEVLRHSLIEGLGLKPRFAFGPLRTALSGQRISPPLFESMEILGRDESLARLRALRASL